MLGVGLLCLGDGVAGGLGWSVHLGPIAVDGAQVLFSFCPTLHLPDTEDRRLTLGCGKHHTLRGIRIQLVMRSCRHLDWATPPGSE